MKNRSTYPKFSYDIDKNINHGQRFRMSRQPKQRKITLSVELFSKSSKEIERTIAKISLTSPIYINVPTRVLLPAEIKSSFVPLVGHLNNKKNVCKQLSSL